MDEIKVDISGDMSIPKDAAKGQFDFSSFTKFQKIPSPVELIQMIRQCLRPWSEFLNTNNFKSAASMPRLSSRFVRNLDYYKSNYIFVFVVLMIYCLITSPLLLLVLAGVAFVCHRVRKVETTVSIFGYQMSTAYQIMAINIVSVPILFLVGAGSALFWTLGASCFVICLHAVFYNIDAIVTEETDGFLSEVV